MDVSLDMPPEAWSEELLREDEQNRERALDIESFIIEAPAGAGKTELLTQRFLKLLGQAEEPEEIVALTFTNKAAGEMRERIQESLRCARDDEAPAEVAHKRKTFALAQAVLVRSAERGWQIEMQPGRLRLITIDALCTRLARQMPLLTRFGAQPGLAEDAQRHYAEAARRTLEHLESSGEHAEAVAVTLDYLDNDVTRLASLLADMLARREQWREVAQFDHPESAIHDAVQAMVDEELAQIADVLDEDWQRRLMPMARFAAAQLGGGVLQDWMEPLLPDTGQLPLWRALADLLLTKENEPRKIVTVKQGFPAAKEFKSQKDAMLEILAALDARRVGALQRLRELPQPNHANDTVVRALVRLMKLAAAELWLVFREHGEVDFGELAARAIDALGDELDPTDLGLRLDYRIRHLLVDEFQDTSPLQIDLLKRLTAGWQAGDGRTLFAVGDPMQSIYRFRRAEVGLFLRAAQTGIGGLRLMPLRLSRNNRSCPEVVSWINAHFPAVFPADDDPVRGEIRYRPFVATRDTLPQAGVAVHPLIQDAQADEEAAAQDEAQAIIKLIAAERQIDPQRQIAVLVRARNHLSALVTALRRQAAHCPPEAQADWRFTAVDIEPLVERQVVQDLIALTRALHHRADRLNWLAILRAPWCGLTLADLFALAGDDHMTTVWSLMNDAERLSRLSDDGQQRLGHLCTVMAEALAGQGRQRRRVWVEDVWKKLGGPLCLAHADEQLDAQAFFKRLEALDAAGRFAIDRLENDMEGLFAAPDVQADGRLQLMTIHKSKGLEFDTIILPGLHRKTSGNDASLLAWDSVSLPEGERLLVAPVNPRRADKMVPSLYDFLQKLEKQRKENEEARVLYVAATRAIRCLHLVGTVFCKASDSGREIALPSATSPLGRLWPALEADFVNAGQEMADIPATAACEAPLAEFVPQLVRQKKPQLPTAWQAPAGLAGAVYREELATNALAAALGTLTHACLEQIAGHVKEWDAVRLAHLQPAAERWLAGRGWPQAESTSGAARVIEMLRVTLNSADGQWVLRMHEGAVAELALSKVGAGDAVTQTRVVDRSFIDDGVRWIIDYKTAELGAQASDIVLAAHAERFRAQLEGYSDLFHGEGLPLQLAIFYVAHGKLVRFAR